MPEEVASKNFLMTDDGIAVTASLLKSEIVDDMLAFGATEELSSEDNRPLLTLDEAFSAV